MPSFGELLKRERELRQISLREVSEATKINLRYLEMLERNDFRHLPGGVFNKGFVRAYAQYIGVDAERMINAYLLEERGQSETGPSDPDPGVLRGRGRGESAPTRPSDDDTPATGVGRTGRIVIAVIVVVVVGVAVWWVLSRTHDTAGTPTPDEAAPVDTASPSPTSSDAANGGDAGGGARHAAGASASDEPSDPADLEEDGDGGATAVTPEDLATAEPAPATATETSEAPGPDDADERSGPVEVTFLVVRETTGRIVCDRRVEMLDGRPAGAEVAVRCSDLLLVEVADGGALRYAVGDEPDRSLGPDGTPVRGRSLLGGPE